jgi:hypothetical protein
MRMVLPAVAVLLVLVSASVAHAEPGTRRYGIDLDLKSYPQSSPQETLSSVLKAIENKRVDYLLAYLADPEFVDRRVKESGGKFEDLVKETQAKLVDDPGPAKLFRRFLKDGAWEIGPTDATASHKEVKDRVILFHKMDGRWFLKNDYKP